MKIPVAAKEEEILFNHNIKRIDSYGWLKDRNDPRTIPYIESENAYCRELMKPNAPLRAELYQEMLDRIVEDDESVPVKVGDWWRYSRTEKGKAYRIYCRKFQSLEAKEEIVLDENELATGNEYFHLESLAYNPAQTHIAWTQDTDGSEHFQLFVKELQTGKLDTHIIEDLKWSLAWGDDHTLFYTKGDDAQRPYQIWKREIFTVPEKDQLVWEEPDERFFLGVSRSRNGKYVLLEADSKTTSETRLIDNAQLEKEPSIVIPRKQGVEYSVAVGSDRLFIVSNENAVNFKLLELYNGEQKELIGSNPNIYLKSVSAFANYLVLWERSNGLPQVRIMDLENNALETLHFPDPCYDLFGASNPNFEATSYRLGYSSPVTPHSTFSYNFKTKERTTLKTQPINNFNAADYVCERLWATASDGTKVPISLARKKTATGAIPTIMYGYGSYGYSYPASFRSTWISLMERGFAVSVAHIRGGSDMGRQWYDDGKFFKKMNSFTDFIACADFLVASGKTTHKQIGITGGSAGGLLMGAVLNLRPDIANVCVAQVPFVDVINTMLDPNLPLTVIEYEEWGNPNEEEAFKAMLSYSPYDNVQEQDYPHLMVTAGLNDPRVGYWEPAKWVARLREKKTDSNQLILRTHMGAGHGGSSGRYGYLEDLSWEYSFLISHLTNV